MSKDSPQVVIVKCLTCSRQGRIWLWKPGGMNSSLPKKGHILIPRTCGCITLRGKRDFADGITLGILRLPWMMWVDPKSSQGSLEEEAGGSGSEKEVWVILERCGTMSKEHGQRPGHWERQRRKLSLEPPGGTSLPTPCQIYILQNHNITNLCCYKPLSL